MRKTNAMQHRKMTGQYDALKLKNKEELRLRREMEVRYVRQTTEQPESFDLSRSSMSGSRAGYLLLGMMALSMIPGVGGAPVQLKDNKNPPPQDLPPETTPQNTETSDLSIPNPNPNPNPNYLLQTPNSLELNNPKEEMIKKKYPTINYDKLGARPKIKKSALTSKLFPQITSQPPSTSTSSFQNERPSMRNPTEKIKVRDRREVRSEDAVTSGAQSATPAPIGEVQGGKAVHHLMTLTGEQKVAAYPLIERTRDYLFGLLDEHIEAESIESTEKHTLIAQLETLVEEAHQNQKSNTTPGLTLPNHDENAKSAGAKIWAFVFGEASTEATSMEPLITKPPITKPSTPKPSTPKLTSMTFYSTDGASIVNSEWDKSYFSVPVNKVKMHMITNFSEYRLYFDGGKADGYNFKATSLANNNVFYWIDKITTPLGNPKFIIRKK